MNKNCCKEIDKPISSIEDLLAVAETLRDEEQEAFDTIPESLQGRERGSQSEEAANELSNAVDSPESARDHLENVKA